MYQFVQMTTEQIVVQLLIRIRLRLPSQPITIISLRINLAVTIFRAWDKASVPRQVTGCFLLFFPLRRIRDMLTSSVGGLSWANPFSSS